MVDAWARDTVKWYWSAGTLFWQLSIDQNIDVQYVCIIELFWKNSSYVSGVSVCIFVAS